ncbi:class I SAM-dependent methyltransferase [Desulfoluna spongiiphila]|uniref:Methyltransferase domain-containing protein n=1 Tax=Desulfoluna spongiiphila TaxID=419481 RepID=A0A1G5JNL0_9BACT|nr:class I SAM-dependent methyltransferase [Desulfoluna spongiiphila]SCY89926.1 Methyltransferase domain-containing protein [Desulfoluna spongiiphila]
MKLKYNLRISSAKVKSYIFFLCHLNKERFRCAVCNYKGPFEDVAPPTGTRKHAKCPQCNALERHRIQYLVVNKILNNVDTSSSKMLHFAPESFFRDFFSKRFGQYETADISMQDVDHRVDLQELPFKSESYDFIFASHVLEHISNDRKAISEIRRILKPNGIAILPVPIVSVKTIEYPKPNPNETYHVRAPGLDYFDRFDSLFTKVEKFNSNSFPAEYQLFIYENRTQWPTTKCPLRPRMKGEKHIDIVPVCYA